MRPTRPFDYRRDTATARVGFFFYGHDTYTHSCTNFIGKRKGLYPRVLGGGWAKPLIGIAFAG